MNPAAGPDESPPYPESDKTARTEFVVYDVVQVLGSLLILAAFALGVAGRLDRDGAVYLALNALGSSVLAAVAVLGQEWGFLLLEGVWALVSLATLARRIRARSTLGGAVVDVGPMEVERIR